MNAPQAIQPLAAAAAEAVEGPSELERLLRQQPFSVRDLLHDDMLDKVMRLAELMASSRITCPKHLQGNVGDCAAVIGQAMRWGMDHNAVAQKTHLVNGALGYEAQLIIAVLNNSRALATRLDFEWFGDWTGVDGKNDKSPQRGVRVWATMRGEQAPRRLEVTMAQVGAVRNSPNWASDPRQQVAYLAAKRWGRLHAPDVILGVYTPDELEDAVGAAYERPHGYASSPAPAQVAPPTWPDESFKAQFPRWEKAVQSGLKTAADIEALATSKGALTAEQLAAIRALRPAAPAPAPAPAPETTPATDGWAAEYDAAASEGAQQ